MRCKFYDLPPQFSLILPVFHNPFLFPFPNAPPLPLSLFWSLITGFSLLRFPPSLARERAPVLHSHFIARAREPPSTKERKSPQRAKTSISSRTLARWVQKLGSAAFLSCHRRRRRLLRVKCRAVWPAGREHGPVRANFGRFSLRLAAARVTTISLARVSGGGFVPVSVRDFSTSSRWGTFWKELRVLRKILPQFFRREELGSFFIGVFFFFLEQEEQSEVCVFGSCVTSSGSLREESKGTGSWTSVLVIGFGAGQLSCRTRFLRGPADSENRVQFVM